MRIYLIALLSVWLATEGDILLARSWQWPTVFPLALALLAAHFGLWLHVLARLPVTIAVPLTATNYLFNSVLVQYQLGEHVSGRVWLGTLVIIAGVVLVTSSAKE